MKKRIEQKLKVYNFNYLESEIKKELDNGWEIKQMVPECVSISGYTYGNTERGRVAVLLEREVPDEK